MKLIKTEAKEMSEFYKIEEERYNKEWEQMVIEINCLKDRLVACEEFYEEMHNKAQE